MILLFVHGWSVTSTKTYGYLPEAIKELAPANLKIDVKHIFLGKYISFNDNVTLDDVSRAFNQAVKDKIGKKSFSCITHSTGGPVIRNWIKLFYPNTNLQNIPLKHLIMLAPAIHGSPLAQLGKSRINRIKSWFQGIEPGQKILDWLELGSDGQWEVNRHWLNYTLPVKNFYPYVLTGDAIDNKFYDFLNPYLVEKGSDGVVRVCGANANYTYVKLKQHQNELKIDEYDREDDKIAIGILPNTSHTGTDKGIMLSVKEKNFSTKDVVKEIIRCLKVKSLDQYLKIKEDFKSQFPTTRGNYVMISFCIQDNMDNDVEDYDIILLGKNYDPSKLEKGFFVDRQRNSINKSKLTFYLDYDKMMKIPDGKFGIRVVARPEKGFAKYSSAEFRGDVNLLKPNQTVLAHIILNRIVDKNVFQFDDLTKKKGPFIKTRPSGRKIES